MTSSTGAAAGSAPLPLRRQAVRGFAPSGQLPGCAAQLGGLQDEYDTVFFIPDLHAITVDFDPSELAQRTRVAPSTLPAG